MQRIPKAGYRAPVIPFFDADLADELDDREANQDRDDQLEARWQPRWTILFSLGCGMAMWTGIVWLIRL